MTNCYASEWPSRFSTRDSLHPLIASIDLPQSAVRNSATKSECEQKAASAESWKYRFATAFLQRGANSLLGCSTANSSKLLEGN
ncbi:unnamed protein product [Protopolystoma xenopodis]|uniref:Uncharacterized protein n=1 Tax=Protopolystoma xenopodis TaxID=117903 RepID=A0A3S5A050_9PLAT|nr:unnamed protein product [Protopolystoma xenopodis]